MVDGLLKEFDNKLFVMQGRLSPPIEGFIQRFPKLTWQSEFEMLNSLNLDGIEWTVDLDGFSDHPLVNPNFFENKFVIDQGKIHHYITCDFFMQLEIYADIQTRQIKLDNLNQFFFELLNSPSIKGKSTLIVPLVDNGSPLSSDDWNCTIEFFKNFETKLRNSGCKIAFELDLNPISQKEFIDELGSELYGVNYDTGNSTSMGWDPNEEIVTLNGLIFHVHIKDRKFKGSTVPLGKGDTNFVQIFKLLRTINYRGSFTLQAARIPEINEIDTIRSYVNFIRKIGAVE
jgi:L-ribulose-5-phosphate 3-epimerase